MIRKASVICGMAAMFMSAGFAQGSNPGAGVKYDFAELRFLNVDAGAADGDGISIGGSHRLNRDFFLEGSYSDIEFDGGFDLNILSVGGGYIYPYQNFDLVSKVRLIDADSDAGSDTGFGLVFGLRHYITRQFEVRGSFNYVDVADSDSFFEFSGDFHLNSQFSVGLTFNVGAEDDTWSFGGRYYY